MSTHNIGFYEDWIKIIFQLSSNMHLISSSAEIMVKTIVRLVTIALNLDIIVLLQRLCQNHQMFLQTTKSSVKPRNSHMI